MGNINIQMYVGDRKSVACYRVKRWVYDYSLFWQVVCLRYKLPSHKHGARNWRVKKSELR